MGVYSDDAIEESIQGTNEKKYTHTLHYQNGQHCHAYGARSAHVQVYCGVDNKVLSVREPKTCTYLLEMESPAACTLSYAVANGLNVTDIM